MKVSGFTFIRNAVKYDFPIIEAIQSALPIVDEFIVNVGNSEDDTLELIRSLDDKRIKIVESIWDETLKQDGRVLGMQQDIALSHCSGDWAFLVQGDEVIHEDDLPVIHDAMNAHIHRENILGLVFRVLHFKGDYWSLDPWMYRKATRVVRTNRQIQSSADGCDFRTEQVAKMIKSGPSGQVIPARVFHYGWVKDPETFRAKKRIMESWWHGNTRTPEELDQEAALQAQFPNYSILKDFNEPHPHVMQARLARAKKIRARRNRWLNWKFYREVINHGFKG
ncbi:MAG: hypothetical protein NPIRA01_19410 [Nitrospirales bacterium]|nr:MAG: hypothetical protein NPIRA01_19410 [Nitrospirales bacterium]